VLPKAHDLVVEPHVADFSVERNVLDVAVVLEDEAFAVSFVVMVALAVLAVVELVAALPVEVVRAAVAPVLAAPVLAAPVLAAPVLAAPVLVVQSLAAPALAVYYFHADVVGPQAFVGIVSPFDFLEPASVVSVMVDTPKRPSFSVSPNSDSYANSSNSIRVAGQELVQSSSGVRAIYALC
jgi:hypothetical protein